MQVHSKQPIGEFLADLRVNWIKHGVSQPYLDKLDELAGLRGADEQQDAEDGARLEGEEAGEQRRQWEIDELRDENDELRSRIKVLESAASRIDHPVPGE